MRLCTLRLFRRSPFRAQWLALTGGSSGRQPCYLWPWQPSTCTEAVDVLPILFSILHKLASRLFFQNKWPWHLTLLATQISRREAVGGRSRRETPTQASHQYIRWWADASVLLSTKGETYFQRPTCAGRVIPAECKKSCVIRMAAFFFGVLRLVLCFRRPFQALATLTPLNTWIGPASWRLQMVVPSSGALRWRRVVCGRPGSAFTQTHLDRQQTIRKGQARVRQYLL
jgi:hypothetical protein